VTELLKTIISLLPVFVFLILLVFMDSYKLLKFRSICLAIGYGFSAAILCYFINNWAITLFKDNLLIYSRYAAPFLEETSKAIYIIYLLRGRKIGFLVDAAIYGFAVGAGFSFVENLYYLGTIQSQNLLLWIIRGFGTAIMHGGTTSIMAILSTNFSNRFPASKFLIFLPGFIISYIIHSLFNHFLLSPVFTTILQLITLPPLMILSYHYSEKNLQEWLEAGMDVDVWLLEYINSGKMYQTKVGEYLNSLKNRFPGEVVADMLCYIRIHLELAIRAKGILLMRESGFLVPPDPEIREKLAEMKYLEHSLGKTGKLALSPILHTSTQEFWQLYILGKK
jgi:RsiW-degrading membrane proteinase PrsW (M82 family)